MDGEDAEITIYDISRYRRKEKGKKELGGVAPRVRPASVEGGKRDSIPQKKKQMPDSIRRNTKKNESAGVVGHALWGLGGIAPRSGQL